MPTEIFSSPAEFQNRFGASGRRSVLTVGNFDGTHLGHQKILRDVVAGARTMGAIATVVTFEPPPLKVLRPEVAPPRISTVEQRIAGFRELGLDAAVILKFDWAFSQISPDQFVCGILVEQLRLGAILVSDNFRFGHKHAGDVALLRALGSLCGFETKIIAPVSFRGEIISSTAIRKAVGAGQVSRAARLLGRPFVLSGQIRPGTGTGSKLVVPTLNLNPQQELLPARGVYITQTLVQGAIYHSVTNIGIRPTFNGSALAIESHLFDFSKALANGPMEIHFCKHLREERRFNGPEELKAQILKDIVRAQRFWSRIAQARRKRRPAATSLEHPPAT